MAMKAMKRTTGSNAKRSSAMKTNANVAMKSMTAMKRPMKAMAAMNVRAAMTKPKCKKWKAGILKNAPTVSSSQIATTSFATYHYPRTNTYSTWIMLHFKDKGIPDTWLQVFHKEKALLGYKVISR